MKEEMRRSKDFPPAIHINPQSAAVLNQRLYKRRPSSQNCDCNAAVWTCFRIHKSTCHRGNYDTPSDAAARRMPASATDIADPLSFRRNASPPPSFGETCRLMV